MAAPKREWIADYTNPNSDDWRVEVYDPHKEADILLARRIAEVLDKHYPGYPWQVVVEHAHGMAYFGIPMIQGAWQYQIKLRELWSDPSMRLVVFGAGEILERYKLSRTAGQFQIADLLAAPRSYDIKDKPPV